MDKFDIAILQIIQDHPQHSLAQVADATALSKTACWRRIQKLEEQGIIRDRAVLLDQDGVNLSLSCFIIIKTNQHTEEWAEQFAEITASIPEVMEVYRMSGDLDYLIKAVVTDMPGYDRLYRQLIQAKLFDVSASFVMETIKRTTKLPLTHIKSESV